MTSIPEDRNQAGTTGRHVSIAGDEHAGAEQSGIRLPGSGSRILIAADKFKGSLTAAQVGEAVRTGINRVLPDLAVDIVPVADGGDGTLAAAFAAGYERVPVTASGPTGQPVETSYARQRVSPAESSGNPTPAGDDSAGRRPGPGDRAVVELADVSGLAQLPGGVLAPLTATSRGTGELIATALDAGCRHIVVGIGGSACTDGGAGMVRALGARLFQSDGC